MKPTAKQLSYLRTLAIRTGQTFTPPTTRADASREIQRLRAATPSDAGEQRRERRDIRDALVVSDQGVRLTWLELDALARRAARGSRRRGGDGPSQDRGDRARRSS